VPYLSALEVCSRQGAIQIHVHLTLPDTDVELGRGHGHASLTLWITRTQWTPVVQCDLLEPYTLFSLNLRPRTDAAPKCPCTHISVSGYLVTGTSQRPCQYDSGFSTLQTA